MAMSDEGVAVYLAWRQANPREALIQDEMRQFTATGDAARGVSEMTRRIADLESRTRKRVRLLAEIRDRLCREAHGVSYEELIGDR
jgi:hypothetical protein